jgi:diguanylate cyclase (GGDEF)-like protein
MKKRDRRATVTALAGVIFVLCSIAALTAWSLARSRSDFHAVSHSIALSDAYRDAVDNAALADLYARRVFLEHDMSATSKFQTALLDAFNAAQTITDIGSDDDRQLLADLQTSLLPETTQAFNLLASLSEDQIASIDPNSALVIDELYSALRGPAQARHEDAVRSLASYRASQDLRSILTLVAFAIGIPSVAGLLLAIHHYEQEDAKRSIEMGQLKEAALTDNLTGLGNHRAFQEELKREASSASRAGNSLSVAIMDVDDFKMVNDESGHAEGDRVLAEFANLLTYTRPDGRGFRVGGDEFALIMPGLNATGAGDQMERLRALTGRSLGGVTVSIGISSAEGSSIEPEVLRERADVALYEAKRSGKDQVATFQGDFYQKGNVSSAKAKAFRELLHNRDLPIAFQPIVSFETGGVLAFEALARPGGDAFEGPYDAFEVADRLGRTWELDQLCIEKAFDSFHLLPNGAVLFVNLDPRSLTNTQFEASKIAALAAAAGVDCGSVVIELTERTAIPGSLLLSGLDSLRRAGFRVALDDVGSGNSGLELLRSAKFDFVKIDRSVILSALERGAGRAVVFALVALGNEIGAQVIAEGVENVAMLNVVRSAINDRPTLTILGLQGYLFGRPAVWSANPGAAA